VGKPDIANLNGLEELRRGEGHYCVSVETEGGNEILRVESIMALYTTQQIDACD
jgi:hypothetical protein